jgi:hypothetical protein
MKARKGVVVVGSLAPTESRIAWVDDSNRYGHTFFSRIVREARRDHIVSQSLHETTVR